MDNIDRPGMTEQATLVRPGTERGHRMPRSGRPLSLTETGRSPYRLGGYLRPMSQKAQVGGWFAS
jgi:hypothetical protein